MGDRRSPAPKAGDPGRDDSNGHIKPLDATYKERIIHATSCVPSTCAQTTGLAVASTTARLCAFWPRKFSLLLYPVSIYRSPVELLLAAYGFEDTHSKNEVQPSKNQSDIGRF